MSFGPDASRHDGEGAPPGLSADFERTLARRLARADAERGRIAARRRWRWTGFVVVPVVAAACWAAVPWTFGIGATALIGFLGYYTFLLAIAERINTDYLAFLGLSTLPTIIDVLLLVGVVSWLAWASRSAVATGRVAAGQARQGIERL